jgi:hypothetical protein
MEPVSSLSYLQELRTKFSPGPAESSPQHYANPLQDLWKGEWLKDSEY